MEITGTLLGMKASKSKANRDLFEGYILIDEKDAPYVAHGKATDIVGKVTLTIKAWEPDATNFINTIMNEKLIDKKVKLLGTDENFIFKCCMIQKA